MSRRAAGLVFWSLALTGAGLGIAYAATLPRLPQGPVPPAAPPAAPPGVQPAADPVADWVDKDLRSEQQNPLQYWYNRGFDGETLATIPQPTDVYFALGQREKARGLNRRNIATNPPAPQDWAAVGITRLIVQQKPTLRGGI